MGNKVQVSQTQETKIKALFESGVSQKDIALEVGMNISTLGRVLARMGLKRASDVILPNEREMLQELKNNGITDVEGLRYVLNKM